ncbi:MAG: RDD family protein, partial [Planctomycetes bacterium]|nr:RDD family protein [Planctomycetota bacterium]
MRSAVMVSAFWHMHQIERVAVERRRRRVFVACMTLMSVLTTNRVWASDAPSLRLAGNNLVLWVYRHDPPDVTKRHRGFAYLRGRTAAPKVFVPLPIPPLRGSVDRHALVGMDLHVFFTDGTHRRYVPIEMNWSARTMPLQFPERDLPQRTIPHALAGDAVKHVLYAIVTSEVAAALEKEPPGEPESIEPGKLTVNDEKSELDTEALTVVRYQKRNWLVDRTVPGDITIKARIHALVVGNGVVHLFYHAPSSDGVMLHRYSADPTAAWSRPVPIPIESDETLRNAGWVNQKLTLLIGGRSAEHTGLRVLELEGRVWRTTIEALDTRGPTGVASLQSAVSVFGDLLAVAALDVTGQVQIDFQSLTSGSIDPAPPTVSLFNRPWQPGAQATLKFVIQYGIFALILAAVFFWRRDSVIRFLVPPPNMMLARFGPRLMALLLDMTIVAPLWLPCVFMLWSWTNRGLSFAEQLALSADLKFGWIFWTWSVVGGIVGLYGATCEATTGTTPGKRIFKLQVVGDDFLRPSGRRVLLRNLLRIVEFHFLP